MKGKQSNPPLFLLGQQLSELVGVGDPEQRRFHVCGSVPEPKSWEPRERSVIGAQAFGREPWPRVALVCDAGLGKTTNLEWLAASMAPGQGSRQVPLLLYLNTTHDLDLLNLEQRAPGALLDRMAALVTQAAGGHQVRHRQALFRLQSGGRITLLLDGLDHALSRPNVPRILKEILQSEQWQACPVWIAGRPHAFDTAWGLFADPAWKFLRVEPLAEAEIRFYLEQQAGGDWYDELAPEGRGLLAVPRLLRLTAGILDGAVRSAGAGKEDQRQAVASLDLGTASDVYHLAYFTPGESVDPKHEVPGQGGANDRCGLLASGLVGEAATIGLRPGEEPSRTNYPWRIQRTAMLLGAIAFEMFATNRDRARPKPNLVGVTEEGLQDFKGAVCRRLLEEGVPGRDLEFGGDFDKLILMNNQGVDFLLFRELGQKGLAWHDRTVQAFFAAYWAMKFGLDKDRKLLQGWAVDAEGKALDEFDEFWTFAAELPDALLDRQWEGWLKVFQPCYAPPQQVKGSDDLVQWHRRMVYHSYLRMQGRVPETIRRWRDSFHALGHGTAKQKRIYQEIEKGFQLIPGGICPYGADSLAGYSGIARKVGDFWLHQWPLTNEMYEVFDPSHRASRWVNEWKHQPHQLAGKRGRQGEDWCPVVNVTWYDAWCFAAWCGYRLPTELEWEHACRAGSKDGWYFGNDEAELEKNCWVVENSNESTHPVGELKANANGLYDMHGNVEEWCDDRWEPGALARVLRGGCWSYGGGICRSAHRNGDAPLDRNLLIGFRLAAVPAVGAKPVQASSGA